MNRRPNPEPIDDENPEWTPEEVARALPFTGLPQTVQKKLRGRPKAAMTKEQVAIRFDKEVIAAFRAAGPGWQTRMNDALKDWLKDHSPA